MMFLGHLGDIVDQTGTISARLHELVLISNPKFQILKGKTENFSALVKFRR
jgi:uncharacterized membrane protein